MKIYLTKPASLAGRDQQNSVAINCPKCRIDFMWLKTAGDDVTCPRCKTTETLDIANATPITPSTSEESA